MMYPSRITSRGRRKPSVTAAVVAIVLCGACSVGAASPADANSSAPGIASKTVNLGLLYDVTGSDSAGNNPTPGAVARIDLQNSQGGVNGRKITFTVGDGQSTATGALSASRILVQKHVFGIMAGAESFLFGAYRYLSQENIPVTGTGIDGPEWGDPTTKNMFDALGAQNDSTAFTTVGKFFKSQGCKSLATEGYQTIPNSAKAANAAGRSALAAGLKNPLNDLSVSLTSTDLTPQALNIRKSGADCIWTELAPPAVLGLTTALQQDGLTPKAIATPVGYGDVSNASSTAAQRVDFIPYGVVPAELNTPSTKAMMSAIHKYTSYSGDSPDIAIINGWLSADLMIKGLQVAGKNPTQASFEKALHGVTNYTAGGVGAGEVNFKQSLQGTWPGEPSFGRCFYATKYSGTKYNVLNNGKPYCGTAIH